MKDSKSKAYAEAGVDIEAGYKSVELMKEDIAKTNVLGVLSDIGGFGGLFEPDLERYEEPVFVSGTDGVGTKIRIAELLNKHDSIGVDCVAMCVNDIVACGAKPLFFLDYIATGKNEPQKIADIVHGVSVGCIEAGCALIGGETAEHPGIMQEDDYDLAGFTVGIVDKKKIINPDLVKEGDVLIGLASSGLHSNGFSLVRKVFDVENIDLNQNVEELNESLGEALLTPTKIYVKAIQALLKEVDIHGISHITGGGFFENIPRMLPSGLAAKIDKNNIPNKPIFSLLQERGNISEHDMFNTFNMGVGMVIALDKEDVNKALEILNTYEEAFILGEVIEGEGVYL